MSFKAMKFLVENEAHSAAIQKALFALGYEWKSIGRSVQYADKKGLWAEADGSLAYSEIEFLMNPTPKQKNQFHYLVNGVIVPTAEVSERPPLGLRPNWVVDNARAIEIMEAITRYVQALKPVPYEWYEELSDRLKFGEKE